MILKKALLFLCFLRLGECKNINEFYEEVNKDFVKFNAIAADIEWEMTAKPNDTGHKERFLEYQRKRVLWQQETCDYLNRLEYRRLLNHTQQRQSFLLCRGPKYNKKEVRLLYDLYEKMEDIYSNTEVCVPTSPKLIQHDSNYTEVEDMILENISTDIAMRFVTAKKSTKEKICFKQDVLEKLVVFSRNEVVLRWVWLAWREPISRRLKDPFIQIVNVENQAARRNGYNNIGESWREEMEIPNLRHLCRQLYKSVKPLYTLLHGVVRFHLRKLYGEVVPQRGPIPAHLLGNLWAQNWDALSDLIVPSTIDLDESIMKLNWSIQHMVKRTEDFYLSLGLPAMTNEFWRESIFTRENNDNLRCHGTAANMFKNNDFRLLYCSGKTFKDFNVLHHEMGHIQYYMAYVRQPGLFRQANTALQESIGDAIMVGAMTPQHLHRLRIINDSLLYNSLDYDYKENIISERIDEEVYPFKRTQVVIESKKRKVISPHMIRPDIILMLKRALNKLPQIPFSLLIDEYRWRFFEGSINEEVMNEEFWRMSIEMQGVSPPEVRDEDNFDAGAIYHVADNTPHIRYFLSSFIQHQFFENFCNAAVYGNQAIKEPLPKTVAMHKCDIYGAKVVGKILKNLMSRGHSQNWREILKSTIGQDEISPEALLRYYRPLQDLLSKLVFIHNIPIGW